MPEENKVGCLGYMKPGLGPTEKALPGDFRWAAGFYEGEGTCSGRNRSLQVAIVQMDRWALERLKALFGGTISPNRRAKNDVWVWNTTGARARGFLQSIYGLLSPRRQTQALLAMIDAGGLHRIQT